MAALPDGTATFLFSDIEGSSRMLDQRPALQASSGRTIDPGAFERTLDARFDEAGLARLIQIPVDREQIGHVCRHAAVTPGTDHAVRSATPRRRSRQPRAR